MKHTYNKKGGQIDLPYTVGDYVDWFCYDDYRIHKSKIISVEIKIVKGREPIICYSVRIKHKGVIKTAVFTERNINDAQKIKESK